MTLILTRSDIDGLLDMCDVIEAVERAHAGLTTGDTLQSARAPLLFPGSSGMLLPMPAAIASMDVVGVKLLTDTPGNALHGMPAQQSLIVLFRARTGEPEAILDGAALTRTRTAATSAVATRHLARADARTLGLIGCGALARAHLDSIRHVRTIERVVAWSRTPSTSQLLVEHAKSYGLDVDVVPTPQDVIARADVVCTLTPSRTPLVRGEWFRPGQHINAVGAPPRPDHREIDSIGIARSRVVVDCLAVALEESGEVVLSLREGSIQRGHLCTELGDVVTGSKPGRQWDREITLFNSVGLGIQDMATARLVVDKARKKELGLELSLAQ
jgi:ornithine cyclodeaminase/alanine dehydrogenase